jgi:inosine-uridine nucleoside N-ribohydrolase
MVLFNLRYIFLSSISAKHTKNESQVKVIVDVDAGVDDAMALLLLLSADGKKDIEILGITCCHGNTHVNNVCINVLRLLEAVGRSDVS